MADPDTGDVILKLQNENDTDVEAYKELTDAVVLNLYDQIIYLDGNTDRLLSLSCLEGKPMYVQRTISDSMDNLCKLFQMPVCTAEKFMEIAKRQSASGETYGRTLTLEDGHVKFVRAKPLYNGSDKYIIAVSDVTHAKNELI